MAEERGRRRYRDGGYSASHRRPYEVPRENRYRCESFPSGSNRYDSRNRYNVGRRWNGSSNRRDSREDRHSYVDIGYGEDRRRAEDKSRRDDRHVFDRGDCNDERFRRDDRRSFPERDGRNDRRESGERLESAGRWDNRHSSNRNDSRQHIRDLNNQYETDQRHDQSSNIYSRNRRDTEAQGHNPTVFNFQFVSDLQKEEPSAILTTLSNPETDLRNGLFQCFRRPYVARLLLSAVSKAFTCTAAQEQFHNILKILKESGFIDKSMEFILSMQKERRINEQATFRQSIMDILSVLKEMNKVEKYKLSQTEVKGVRTVINIVIDYLKENTTEVINDELLDAFQEFTEKPNSLTKGLKRNHKDSNLKEDSDMDEPAKKLKDVQATPSTEATQSRSSGPSDTGDDDDDEIGSNSIESIELECKLILQCGHKCQTKCNMEHTETCEFVVEKTFSCGHNGIAKCFQKDSALCPRPCGTVLKCEHPCTGTCGECFQGRLHKPCENKCKRILVCEHECLDRCNECPPCTRKCENRCQHSKCNKTCGELCIPCKETCTWNCEHFKCGKLCSEPCDRPRCDRPCEKKLPCSHQCIGLCGEPCPSDCRICDKEKVTEMLFGNEDEPDAKFVLLEDCTAKCIIESGAMDYYMDQKNDVDQIKLIECPKCITPIRKSNRYRKLINENLQNIERVKGKLLCKKYRVNKFEADIFKETSLLTCFPFAQQIRRRLVSLKAPKSEKTLVAMKNQLSLLKGISDLEKEWKDQVKHEDLKVDLETSLNFLHKFQNWVMLERSVMTREEISDALLEISRSRALMKLLLYMQKAKEVVKDIDSSLKLKVTEVENLLKGSKKYDKQLQSTVEACLKELKDVLPLSGLGVSEEERIMIVKAMDLEKGHWYKCPNGHIYAIGECGGANEVSSCPDCKSEIGGQRHRLLEDNTVATEMDGARYGAWSEQANMENYDPFDIQF